MSWVFIEPGDVWSFRDAKPFMVGGGHITRNIFPPTPLTIQGALRSLILGCSGVSWSAFREQSTPEAQTLGQAIGYPAAEGRPATLGSFSMAGPFLARVEGDDLVRYAPLPADVRRIKGHALHYFTLRPMHRVFETNWPVPDIFPLWPQPEENVETPEEPEWVRETALDDYLHGHTFAGLKAEKLFHTEPRLGIALDYGRRRPVPSMLYQVEFIRPATQVGLLVQLSDQVKLPARQGTMRLGGEGRSAYYRTVPDSQIKTVVADAGLRQPTKQLKLVLLTPAYFDGAWQPADGNAGWSRLLGRPVRLVAAALERPQRIGGWDLAARGGRGWHKPLRAYVPAGSVYLFESERAVPPPLGPVTQTPDGEDLPLDRLGFGQIVTGTWEWLN